MIHFVSAQVGLLDVSVSPLRSVGDSQIVRECSVVRVDKVSYVMCVYVGSVGLCGLYEFT